MRRATSRLVLSACRPPHRALVGTALALIAATAALVAPSASIADPRPVHEGEPPARAARLSDERTLTRWTGAVRREAIRRRPRASSAAVARLRFYTEDQRPEVYVAIEQRRGRDGRLWVRLRVPMRPNGTTGWVHRGALGPWRVNRDLLHVDRRTQTAVLLHRGRRVWRSRVGVGKRGTPTPAGRFYVRERLRNLARNPVYGPIAFGTSAYSRLSDWPGGGVIGIHGTDQPRRLPGRVSHGCVRVPNRAIRRLARRLSVGTPVLIDDGRLT